MGLIHYNVCLFQLLLVLILPSRRDSQAELPWLVDLIPRWCKCNTNPWTFAHRSNNQIWHSAATPIETSVLQLCQTATRAISDYWKVDKILL